MNIIIKKIIRNEVENAFKRLNGKEAHIIVTSGSGNAVIDAKIKTINELIKLINNSSKNINTAKQYIITLKADDEKIKELSNKLKTTQYSGKDILEMLKQYA